MNKFILWGTCMLFAVAWLIGSFFTEDYKEKQHRITRSTIYVAASFIILGFPS